MSLGEPPEQPENKRYTEENIFSAKDVGGCVEAYRRCADGFRNFSELVDFQTAVADRLHELGDEEKSAQFTILASQTRNVLLSKRVGEMMGDIIGDFNKTSNRLGEKIDGFDHSIGRFGEGVEELRIVSGKILSASSEMERASQRIESSSRNMR